MFNDSPQIGLFSMAVMLIISTIVFSSLFSYPNLATNPQ